MADSSRQSDTARHGVVRQRVIDYGEVFTPPKLVNDMLDLVRDECAKIDSRFLEPACGTGNFLTEVLRRKLVAVESLNRRTPHNWERDALLSLASLYGIDLQQDNVQICRERLFEVLAAAGEARNPSPLAAPLVRVARYILDRNIVQGDALTLRAANGRPIVFSEWTRINGSLVKRKDFTYEELLGQAEDKAQAPLFSDSGDPHFAPRSIGEYAPCHYLQLADAGEQYDRS